MRYRGQIVDLVLIDNDELIHGTWKMVARSKKHHLFCFQTLEEFLDQSLPRLIPIYLDFHFQNGPNGIELAKILYQKGYKNLYITTGSCETTEIDKPKEVISILDKEYPL